MASKTVEAQLEKILAAYANEESEAIAECFQSAGEQALQTVKDLSPKSPSGGSYASSWTLQKSGKKAKGSFLGGSVNVTVYNAKHYQLTHLLNNGHVIANQYGQYGRKAGDDHIGRAQEVAEKMLLDELGRKL